MNEHNPYSAPESDISVDIGGGEQYQPKILATQGRIGRMRYWVYNMLMTFALYAVIGIAFGTVGVLAGGFESGVDSPVIGTLMVVAYAIVIVAGLAITFIYAKRRLHDVNQSGWLSLLMLVPIANLVLWLYLLFAKGNVGSNKYGPQPVPNSAGVKIGFALSLLLFVGGILAAIAVPTYLGFSQQAEFQSIEFSAE